jgi:hypothetical protein
LREERQGFDRKATGRAPRFPAQRRLTPLFAGPERGTGPLRAFFQSSLRAVHTEPRWRFFLKHRRCEARSTDSVIFALVVNQRRRFQRPAKALTLLK